MSNMENVQRRASVMAMKELAYRATQATSFHPQETGERLLTEAEQGLQSLLEQLPAEMHEYAEQKYLELYRAWLGAMSRCFSVMITGAGNFNNRRHEKTNQHEHNAMMRLIEWKERIVKRANRQHRLTGWDEIARLEDKLDGLEQLQEQMKAANKIVRSKKLSDVEQMDELVALGISEQNAVLLMDGQSWWGKGFAPFQLTNNNAKIKATKERIAQLTRTQEAGNKELEFEVMGGGKVELCAADERIRIYFNSKPSEEERTRIKAAAFKWSPSNGCWQRQLTSNAKYATERLLEVKFNQ